MAILGEYRVGNISDKMFDASIQSGLNPYTGAELKAGEAEQLTAERNQQTEPKGGILGAIANLFGFSKLAAAEPNMLSSQKFSNQFSVTQPSQFDFKGAQLFEPSNIMRGSVVEDVVDTPTREFGQIRAGQDELGIFGVPGVEDVPIDLSELDYRETSEEEDAEAAALLEQAQQEERRSALDILRSFGQDVMNRPIVSSILRGASGVAGGITGLAGLAGPSQSQRAFDAMTPGQQVYTSSLYGRQRDGAPGLLEGYNPVSAFGRGALGTLSSRLDTVRGTLARQGANASPTLQAREKALSDAINTSINIGERQALSDPSRSRGGIRTDIDVADGGAESGGGGKIVCTMMNESYGFGNFRNKIWLRQSKDLAPEYQKGYHILFLPLVKLAKTNKIIRKVLEHIAVHRTIDIRQESRGKTHILGRLYRKVLEPICYWVGKYAKR
jgi:hypothetical protein